MSCRRHLRTVTRAFVFIASAACLSHNFQAQTVKVLESQTPPVARRIAHQRRSLITYNEAGALNSLRALFSAEATYQATTGNGNYGALEELRKEGLVDPVLGEGHRYGYLFRIRPESRSSESPASLEVVAVPRTYGKTGRRSFYVDETGVIYAADKSGAEASLADHTLVIDP